MTLLKLDLQLHYQHFYLCDWTISTFICVIGLKRFYFFMQLCLLFEKMPILNNTGCNCTGLEEYFYSI